MKETHTHTHTHFFVEAVTVSESYNHCRGLTLATVISYLVFLCNQWIFSEGQKIELGVEFPGL